MTSWGLISDVHGNLPALEEALLVLHHAGADRLAFLGDYLGRGDSDGCVRRIRETADLAIVGNRDLDWQDRVAAETRGWVLSLPRTACADGLLLAHGDARLTRRLSTNQIARSFEDAFAELQSAHARIWAFGHSHQARTWRKAAAGAAAEPLGSTAAIEDGFGYFVNVGTTGLPFGGKGGPSVAIVDFSRDRIEHISLTWYGEK